MENIVFYSIKSSICLGLLYLVYHLFVRKETYFRIKRFIILGMILISLVLPSVKIPSGHITPIAYPLLQIENTIVPQATQVAFTETAGAPVPKPVPGSRISPLIIVFLAGVLLQLVMLLVSFAKIARIVFKGRKVSTGNFRIIITGDEISPFSLGRFIIISEKDYQANASVILRHEEMHLRQFHGIDLLIAQLLLVLTWYNPFSWQLLREMRMNHEFEADRFVIREGNDSREYQMLLLRSASAYSRFVLANHFSQSKIKTRINMMNKRRSAGWAYIKVLLFIPLVLFMLQLFARPEMINSIRAKVNKSNSRYLSLGRDQLGLLGIQCSSEGVFYKNRNPNKVQDHNRYSILCFFSTEDVYCCNINLDSPGEKISGSGAAYRMIRKMPLSSNDFYPLLITSFSGHPTWDSYTVHHDSTLKLLPVQIKMADLGMTSRNDTMVFWFKPTPSLKETLSGIANIDLYLKAPALKHR